MDWKGHERRQFIRAFFPCKVTVYTPQRHVFNIYTQDFSEGGIRIMCEEKLEMSSLVGLQVYLDKERIINCQGRVAWIAEKPDPLIESACLYDTGIEFYEMSEDDKWAVRNSVKLFSDKGDAPGIGKDSSPHGEI